MRGCSCVYAFGPRLLSFAPEISNTMSSRSSPVPTVSISMPTSVATGANCVGASSAWLSRLLVLCNELCGGACAPARVRLLASDGKPPLRNLYKWRVGNRLFKQTLAALSRTPRMLKFCELLWESMAPMQFSINSGLSGSCGLIRMLRCFLHACTPDGNYFQSSTLGGLLLSLQCLGFSLAPRPWCFCRCRGALALCLLFGLQASEGLLCSNRKTCYQTA